MDHGLKLKKAHGVIEFNQKSWPQTYADFNKKLRAKAKTNFEKNFLRLMNNSVIAKTMTNVTKHKDIKIVANNRRRVI